MSEHPKREWVLQSIRDEFERTLSDRVERRLEVEGPGVVPNAPFAAPSVECKEMFQDGHFLGCIALAQAVTEAIVRFVWQIKHKKKQTKTQDFEKNLKDLAQRGFITGEVKAKIDRIWSQRNDFHHLNPTIASEYHRLEELAREKLQLLAEVEREFFDYTINNGALVPKHREYWAINERGESLVYVRP